MSDDRERIAVLEANQLRLQQDVHQLFEMNRELYKVIKAHMEKEEDRWEEIAGTLIKWRGFIGGIVFIVSALWAALIGALTFIGKVKFGT